MSIQYELIPYEPYLRTGFFLAVLMLVAAAEIHFPRRTPMVPKKARWFGNLMIHFLNIFVLRLIFPILPVGMAVLCSEKGWGLFNHYAVNSGVAMLTTVVILDLVVYLQHVMFHKVPLFWRIHRMHHTDLHIDVTTGVRFHPFEIMASGLIKSVAVFILGPPAPAVLIFEILLNGAAMFNHGNIHIPREIDKRLRLFIVTPDMHRVHHSVILHENNSNFGFNMSWWDFLFQTYTAQPVRGHESMTIGLTGFRDMDYSTLGRMLSTPFMSMKKVL
jgi:sterol desaturase/sphingolipid hydroxylase (fatty acid hydroxylase superfamily)